MRQSHPNACCYHLCLPRYVTASGRRKAFLPQAASWQARGGAAIAPAHRPAAYVPSKHTRVAIQPARRSQAEEGAPHVSSWRASGGGAAAPAYRPAPTTLVKHARAAISPAFCVLCTHPVTASGRRKAARCCRRKRRSNSSVMASEEAPLTVRVVAKTTSRKTVWRREGGGGRGKGGGMQAERLRDVQDGRNEGGNTHARIKASEKT